MSDRELRGHTVLLEDPGPANPLNNARLAEYIFEWLSIRNGRELSGALDEMTVGSRRDALAELREILQNRGRPSNWVKR